MKRLAMLTAVALLALCLCAPALSEVRSGDRGEEVRYLQWLLIQTGWLTGSADGSFGPKTEQAVIDYQTAKGLDPTGVADAELMLDIDRDRVRQDKEAHGQDYYQPYPGNFKPELTANAAATASCGLTVLPGIAYLNHCERHLALIEQTRDLSASDSVESISEATALWLSDISEQLAASGAPEALAEAWAACIDAQRDAVNATLGDAVKVEGAALAMARNCALTLCELRSGVMPAGADMEPLGPSDGDNCARWSIGADKTFITACDAHGPFFDMECAWIEAGSTDDAAFATFSGAWDDALAALYDDWAARFEGAEEAVEAARAAFIAALDAQDAAFSDRSGALGHMRMTQLETTRLCEMMGTYMSK